MLPQGQGTREAVYIPNPRENTMVEDGLEFT
jgi:hypothetical protein